MQLRNAPTPAMKAWGYGEGYRHAHQLEDAIGDMECLPESMKDVRFYHPTQRGAEARIGERMEEIRKRRDRAPDEKV